MLNSTIKNRIIQLEPSYRDFVLSDIPVATADKFAKAHGLDEIRSAVLENGIMLFLLFFLDKSELKSFLIEECKLNNGDAGLLVEEVIMSLPEDLRAAEELTRKIITETKEGVALVNTPENITDPATVANISPVMLEEKLLNGNVTDEEVSTLKNNLETYLNDANTTIDKKQEWKEWSSTSTLGLQLNLNFE